MRYEAVLRQEAVDDLDKLALSAVVLSAFFDGLARLEEDPINLSRRPTFPFAGLNALMHHIAFRESEGKHFFTVFFHFGQDEKTLIVTHIGHTLYE